MKRNILNPLAAGILGASLLLGLPACTDDHYDIKPGVESASNTIWQNIESNSQLDSLAMILKRVKVYSKEEDKTRSMTYAEFLDGAQTVTFWAPLNGTYNARQYLDQLDQVDALNAAGSTTAANKLEYNVGVQFAQNHMARFNYESDKGSQEVRLLNGKLCVYNAAEGTFNGVQLASSNANVPSSNGTLHLLSGQSPFSYNIFDYFEAYSDVFNNIYSTLSDSTIDKKTFSETESVPGAMNENGEMVYVDSVYTSDNEMLNMSYAQIKDEDSLYIALAPTDEAWEEAYNKVLKLYNYKTTYGYNYTSKTDFADELNLKASWSGHTGKTLADSLADYNAKKALLTSMYFSPSIWSQEFERDDTEGILNYAYYADSLISTNGVVYYNSAAPGKNPIFGDVEPVKASNGYIFPLTTYTVDPSYSFMERQEIALNDYSSSYNIGDVEGCANSAAVKGGMAYSTLVEDDNLDPTVDVSELGDNLSYTWFEMNGTMRIYIPIPNLYSGKYRIKVQIVPNRADVNHKWYDKDTGEEYTAQQSSFVAYLKSEGGSNIGKRTDDIVVDDNAAKTYVLWDSMEIPNSYVDLPSGIEDCYPLLMLQMASNKQPKTKDTNVSSPTYGLCITKVIVEPVHE